MVIVTKLYRFWVMFDVKTMYVLTKMNLQLVAIYLKLFKTEKRFSTNFKIFKMYVYLYIIYIYHTHTLV